MKRKRFSEEQIIGVLKEHEARGEDSGPVSQAGDQRRDGSTTGRVDVSEARRLRALEGENAKLKKLLAEAHLDSTRPVTAAFAIGWRSAQ